MLERIIDRLPEVSAQEILDQMVPPSTYATVSFSSYRPNPEYGSQKEALLLTENFAQKVNDIRCSHHKLFARRRKINGTGIYLDGGFGVGKTHLLASIYSEVNGKKLFGSFVEYTNLIGALSFPEAVGKLADYSLLCIDEFELDDPGDTMQMSRLLKELSEAGVSIATTSNTLPGQLGEGRFAAKDFLREIQQLANIFISVRIDGPDYRHRDLPLAPQPLTDNELVQLATDTPYSTVDSFDALLKYLPKIHPSKYKKLIEGISLVAICGVHPLSDQSDALRVVSFVDRLYDAGIPVLNSGDKIDRIFTEEMLNGGYRKKYLRAVSRLLALSRMTPNNALLRD